VWVKDSDARVMPDRYRLESASGAGQPVGRELTEVPGFRSLEADGEAPDTVRGFLACLRKRRIEVLVHERVCQVDAGKDGAKGSFSAYGVAEAA
jgi:hypothetical protein